ncbi:MAG: hypothetical protein HQL52_17280 [Magnetococcales bacterium]|nr:hypothetical protein [Magnetococcales bacterium]
MFRPDKHCENRFLVATILIGSPAILRSEETINHTKITETDNFSTNFRAFQNTLKDVHEPIGIQVYIEYKPWLHMLNLKVDKSVDAILGIYKSAGLGPTYPRWPIYSGGVGRYSEKIIPIFGREHLPWLTNVLAG